MSGNNNSSRSSGIGVLGLLGVAFVILKLDKVIDWSWWWVTLPFWGGLVLILIGFIIVILLHIYFLKNDTRRIHSNSKRR